MKRCVRFFSVLLVVSMLLACPAYASTEAESRASSFFLSHAVFLYKTSSNSFQIWFDVDAVESMEEIGSSMIEVFRSVDKENWVKVRTYYKSVYPSMTCTNSGSHVGYVSYTVATGYYYRARVTLYARNSAGGIGERLRYTEIIYL